MSDQAAAAAEQLFPIDVDLGRSPPNRETAGGHPDVDLSIAVALTNNGIWFSRYMSAQEFIRYFLRWFSVRRFQAIKIGEGGPHKTIYPPTPREV